MKEVTREMIGIFKPIDIGYDWMDWEIGQKKEITFHHIREARNGGKCTLRNGAILTRQAHDYLNYLDSREHRLYEELNGLFKELNNTMKPPENDYYEELEGLYTRRLIYVPTRGKHGIYEE